VGDIMPERMLRDFGDFLDVPEVCTALTKEIDVDKLNYFIMLLFLWLFLPLKTGLNINRKL
jgi:hypothetical protein